MTQRDISSSGIEGQIILRPISPIERSGTPNERPYQATVTVLDANGQTVTQFQTDANGRFRVNLKPGTYTLRPESSGTYPLAARQTVTVTDQQFAHVQIAYDTGIRSPR